MIRFTPRFRGPVTRNQEAKKLEMLALLCAAVGREKPRIRVKAVRGK